VRRTVELSRRVSGRLQRILSLLFIYFGLINQKEQKRGLRLCQRMSLKLVNNVNPLSFLP
jgi:hypothetical protein